jgi:starch synthase
VHCNDWQTGLIPVYLKEVYQADPAFAGVGTLLTIHNLAYQGAFPAAEFALTGLERGLFNWRQLESYGRLNFLKAGLAFADRISTVSPTYAQEIQTPAYGCGLDGLLRERRGDLCGIINGIDPKIWHPTVEPMLAMRYDEATVTAGKAVNKADLQRRLGLPERPDVPLFAQIGRLDRQKGWDLLAEVADDVLRGDAQLVVLGEGHPRYHELVSRLVREHPGKVQAVLAFSEPLAHRIHAGSDLFLMPSLYEPCGLGQLYSMVHGTVPIVRATGGLADTVVDATPSNVAEGRATGFTFVEPSATALREAIRRALALWPDRTSWNRLVHAGMQCDWCWNRRGNAAYEQLYRDVHRRASIAADRPETLRAAV